MSIKIVAYQLSIQDDEWSDPLYLTFAGTQKDADNVITGLLNDPEKYQVSVTKTSVAFGNELIELADIDLEDGDGQEATEEA